MHVVLTYMDLDDALLGFDQKIISQILVDIFRCSLSLWTFVEEVEIFFVIY